MVAVRLGQAAVSVAIQELQLHATVSVASVNGPSSVVLSGTKPAVDAVLAALGVQGFRLSVSHAFHSPLISLKAGVMNLLSVTAAYGVMTLFAQGGTLGGGDQRGAYRGVGEAARFLGPARRAVVGDQHRNPGQRDRCGQDAQRQQPVVPDAVGDRGCQERRDAPGHDLEVFADPGTMLFLVGERRAGDEHRATLVVETQIVLHLLTVPHSRRGKREVFLTAV